MELIFLRQPNTCRDPQCPTVAMNCNGRLISLVYRVPCPFIGGVHWRLRTLNVIMSINKALVLAAAKHPQAAGPGTCNRREGCCERGAPRGAWLLHPWLQAVQMALPSQGPLLTPQAEAKQLKCHPPTRTAFSELSLGPPPQAEA